MELYPLTPYEETVGRQHPDPDALRRYKEAMDGLLELTERGGVQPLPERGDDEGSRDDGQELAFGPPADDEAKRAMKKGVAACRAALKEALKKEDE